MPDKARLRGGRYVLPFLTAMVLLWFSFLRDCFFSPPIYDSLFWVTPCLLFLSGAPWFILVIRSLRIRHYVIVDKHGTSRKSVINSVFSALFFALIGGFALLPFIGIGALGGVYVSSTESLQFSATIGIRKGPGGRGCRWYLTFYNRPIEREVTICAEDRGIGGTKSGDVLIFDEKTGPMGARLIDIRHKPN